MEILSDSELEGYLKDSWNGVESIRQSGRFTYTTVDSVALYRMARELKILRDISRTFTRNYGDMFLCLPQDEHKKISDYFDFLDREYKALESEEVPEMGSWIGKNEKKTGGQD